MTGGGKKKKKGVAFFRERKKKKTWGREKKKEAPFDERPEKMGWAAWWGKNRRNKGGGSAYCTGKGGGKCLQFLTEEGRSAKKYAKGGGGGKTLKVEKRVVVKPFGKGEKKKTSFAEFILVQKETPLPEKGGSVAVRGKKKTEHSEEGKTLSFFPGGGEM